MIVAAWCGFLIEACLLLVKSKLIVYLPIVVCRIGTERDVSHTLLNGVSPSGVPLYLYTGWRYKCSGQKSKIEVSMNLVSSDIQCPLLSSREGIGYRFKPNSHLY